MAWALAACAAVLWPAGRSFARVTGRLERGSQKRRRREAVDEPPPSRRDRILAPAAAVAAAAATIALGGLPTGAVIAAVVAPAVGAGVRWLGGRPGATPLDRTLPLTLDLVAAILRSGQPLDAALAGAAPAAAPHTRRILLRVARLLTLGAEPHEAWSSCTASSSVLQPVAAVAVRSSSSGVRLADGFERLAAELRARRAAAAAIRAGRAGVHAMGPLAACFLPSFVCLGIVPLVVGIAAAATGTLQ